MFAVKSKVLEELLHDPEWSRKLENAKTMREVESVLREFAVAKGYKVREMIV
jgi:hypothetical protein